MTLIQKYTFDGSKSLNLADLPTDAKEDGFEKKPTKKAFKKNLKTMKKLQERLYADGREGLIVVFQALDAAGKDSTIKKVMTAFNPQGMCVFPFKAPSSEELAHDFLWRIHHHVPPRGHISIFNRSHYEDVVAVRVRDLRRSYAMADRVMEKDDATFFAERFEQINNFEKYLYQNSYRVVKFFLNVSKGEQKERFLDRINREDKNWKFSPSDLEDRAIFERHLQGYEDAINETGTAHAPWFVLPADQKWYTRYLVSEIMIQVLEDMDPQFPEPPQEHLDKMQEYKELLLNE